MRRSNRTPVIHHTAFCYQTFIGNCGKVAELVPGTARGKSHGGTVFLADFYLINKDFRHLTESIPSWQDKDFEFFWGIARRIPQFFPQKNTPKGALRLREK
jgi:hypothetical protein